PGGHRTLRPHMRPRRPAAARPAGAGHVARLGASVARPRIAADGVPVMSRSLIDRDRAHLWHPYTQMQTAPAPLPIVRGEGVYLFTEDGRRILDGISSWWVNIHGHS